MPEEPLCVLAHSQMPRSPDAAVGRDDAPNVWNALQIQRKRTEEKLAELVVLQHEVLESNEGTNFVGQALKLPCLLLALMRVRYEMIATVPSFKTSNGGDSRESRETNSFSSSCSCRAHEEEIKPH